jgi:tetratricopeptide (TPR) repeat protein
LHQRQLVKREKAQEAFFTIHRSLQQGILQKLNHDTLERLSAFQCAFNAIRSHVPRPAILLQAEPEKWCRLVPYLPQLLHLRQAYVRSTPKIPGSLQLAELLFDVGMNMWDRGLTRDGQEVLRTAEEVLDGIDYLDKSTIRANIHIVLAIILEDTGISGRKEAMQRRKIAYDIRRFLNDAKDPKERTPEDEILVFAALVDLARSFQQNNQFTEVQKICQVAYQKYREWGDVDKIPFEFSKYYRLMGFVWMHHGNTSKAVDYTRRAAKLQEMADPTALLANMFKFDWIRMLFQDGQCDLAITELEALHEQRQRECGRNNHHTLQSDLALGIMYYHHKRFEDAE